MELVLVTGLSGAGRRSVLNALEDTGCATLDNIPVNLLGPLLELQPRLNPGRTRLAVGLDHRHVDFASNLVPELERLSEGGTQLFVIFCEADDATLVRRYSETRRPHFLVEAEGSVAAAVARERRLLADVRAHANAVLDTTSLSLSQLRQHLQEMLPAGGSQGTALRLLSFGFKFGMPVDADMVLDARFLPNPHYEPDLKPLTGREAPVQSWLLASDSFQTFLALAENWLRYAWPYIVEEGRAYHTVAIGCTGGQHRSVALAELLGARLRDEIPGLQVQHRELQGR